MIPPLNLKTLRQIKLYVKMPWLAQRYQALELREQWAIKGLGGLLALLAMYFLIWVPANEFNVSSQANYAKYHELIQYMKATETKARAVAGKSARMGSQNLISTISSSTLRFGIKPNRLQPDGTNGVSVWFDGVNFANLVRWLAEVSQQGTHVRQISIAREPEELGRVNARIILQG